VAVATVAKAIRQRLTYLLINNGIDLSFTLSSGLPMWLAY
jgi:hypothetical protein